MTNLLNAEDTRLAIDWRVELLRCTAFPMPMFEGSAEEIFRLVTQAAPNQVAENRQQARQTAAGEFANAKLDVIKQPGRIDVLCSAIEELRTSEGSRTLGNWGDAVESFDRGIRKWLRTRPDLQRLAFGAICQYAVADRKSAYSVLNRLLPSIDIDVDHSTDLFYQINRPRLANFENSFSCKINRLSKWSAATVVLQTVIIPTAEGGAPLPTFAVPVQNYCRAELDINTDAEINQLPSQHLEGVWDKLTTFAAEILSKGDIQ
jgi:hypothetical protein